MYIDLITKIKNAQKAKKESIKIPYSNMDMAVAQLLADTKLVDSVEKKGRMPKRVIEVKLKYDNDKGVISGVKFVSRPSRRIYSGYKELKPVRQGYGFGIISTPKGIMTTREARKQKVGGQLLFEIW